jgi:hypothetical protein
VRPWDVELYTDDELTRLERAIEELRKAQK